MRMKRVSAQNIISNFPFVISGTAMAVFHMPSLTDFVIPAILFAGLLIASIYMKNVFDFWKKNMSPLVIIASVIVLMRASYCFYKNMVWSSEIQMVAQKMGIAPYYVVILIAIVISIAAFWFCSLVLEYLLSVDEKTGNHPIWNRMISSPIYVKGLRILVVIAFAVLGMCSFTASIWLDESFTLHIIQHSYGDIVRYTAADVHPPLYYIMLKPIVDVFSHLSADFVSIITVTKLFSVCAYLLTAGICWYKLKDNKTNGFRELLILCLAASGNLISFGIEIRMYGWGLFFVTSAYLFAKDIMDEKENLKAWIALIFFSLCSAYTHYFALISVAAIWLYLFLWLIVNKRSSLKRWIISGAITFAGYLPWLFVLVEQTKSVASGYWIPEMTIMDVVDACLYIIPGDFLFVLVLVVICSLDFRKKERNLYRDLTGGLVVFTTLAIGVLFSLAFRPIFVNRYLIPGGFCIWITILLLWSKCKDKQKIITAGILVISSIMSCGSLVYNECISDNRAKEAIALLESMEENSLLYLEEDGADYVLYTLAAYSDRDVYFAGATSQKEVFQDVYENVHVMEKEEGAKWMNRMLEEGSQTIYYLSSEAAEEFSEAKKDRVSLLGSYCFEKDVLVYKIEPKAR